MAGGGCSIGAFWAIFRSEYWFNDGTTRRPKAKGQAGRQNCGARVSISKRRLLFDFLYFARQRRREYRDVDFAGKYDEWRGWRFDCDASHHDVWRDFATGDFLAAWISICAIFLLAA